MSESSSSRVAERTSMFSQTCERLREYIKERGSSSLGTIKPPPPTTSFASSPTTINFFPTTCAPKQMTIFYCGQVVVIDNVSSDKASEIMRMATGFTTSPRLPPADLSLTRSRSLTRFLHKRKERINARAPYAAVSHKSWLGLAAPAVTKNV